MKKIYIEDRPIGEGEPIFICAEVGVTANGKFDEALKLVDAAKEAGADAIKFMIIDPDSFMSDKSVQYTYQWAGGVETVNMYDMFKKLNFTKDEWLKIRDYCKERGIIFYATVDSLLGMDLAEELDLPAYKLSSWDIRFYPLIRRMARTGKPIQVDLGPALWGEICQLIEVIKHQEKNDNIILVHCSHGDYNEYNLATIPYLISRTGYPVGWSSPGRGAVADIVANSCGARLIEKRLTLNQNYHGHHHVLALEPDEFKEYIEDMRNVFGCVVSKELEEEMLGRYEVYPSYADLRMKDLYFTSIVANCDIPEGTVITEDMLACKRPGNGISPMYLDRFYGKPAVRDIQENDLIEWEDV